MNYIRKHPVGTAFIINIALFGLVLTCCFPIFNSGDDVFVLYLLGGGFGQPPTELLHYHYGLHPYLTLPLKHLFIVAPDVNWYAMLLYLLHFIACTAILSQWFKKDQAAFSILAFVVCFAAIETRFLLQPNFTNTAFVTAIAGLVLMYIKPTSLWGYVLLFAASLLRLHLLIPAIIIALPFLLTSRQRKQLFLRISLLAAIIILFVFLQQQHYVKNIPGWQQEEAWRQTVIDHYNIPKRSSNVLSGERQIRNDFLEKGILWDKEFLSKENITATTQAVKLTGAWEQADFRERLHWLLMEHRLGVLIMLLLFLYKFPVLNKNEKRAVISSTIIFFALCTGLMLFRKLPAYIVTGGMLQWLVFTGLMGDKEINSRKRNFIFAGLALLVLVWSVIRTQKLSQWNKLQHQQFTCAFQQLASQRNKLFIVSDDRFPTDHFYVWDAPRQYSFPNLLYKDHFLNNTAQHVYDRFGIRSSQELLTNEKVVLIGEVSASLLKYFESKTQVKAQAKALPANEDCIDTWQFISLP